MLLPRLLRDGICTARDKGVRRLASRALHTCTSRDKGVWPHELVSSGCCCWFFTQRRVSSLERLHLRLTRQGERNRFCLEMAYFKLANVVRKAMWQRLKIIGLVTGPGGLFATGLITITAKFQNSLRLKGMGRAEPENKLLVTTTKKQTSTTPEEAVTWRNPSCKKEAAQHVCDS